MITMVAVIFGFGKKINLQNFVKVALRKSYQLITWYHNALNEFRNRFWDDLQSTEQSWVKTRHVPCELLAWENCPSCYLLQPVQEMYTTVQLTGLPRSTEVKRDDKFKSHCADDLLHA